MATTTINADIVNIGAYIETPGNSNNLHINDAQNAIAGASSHRNVVQCPRFNDAPLDLLSVKFTGREQEIALIIEFLEAVYGDLPTRCALHGMHGVGKSQVTYALAKTCTTKDGIGISFGCRRPPSKSSIKVFRNCFTSCPIQTVLPPTTAPD